MDKLVSDCCGETIRYIEDLDHPIVLTYCSECGEQCLAVKHKSNATTELPEELPRISEQQIRMAIAQTKPNEYDYERVAEYQRDADNILYTQVIRQRDEARELTQKALERDLFQNEQLQARIAELERYDIRQYIPEGKHCYGCRFTRYYYCALVRYFLPKDSSGEVMKHKDCPKPYEEKE